MVDELYVRGWSDCLDVMEEILEHSQTVEEVKNKKIALTNLIKDNKFEKIKIELGAFGLF